MKKETKTLEWVGIITIIGLIIGAVAYYFSNQITNATEIQECKTKIEKQEKDYDKLYLENKQEHKEIILKLDKILLK